MSEKKKLAFKEILALKEELALDKEVTLKNEEEIKNIIRDVRLLKAHSMGKIYGFLSKHLEIILGLSIFCMAGVVVYFSLLYK